MHDFSPVLRNPLFLLAMLSLLTLTLVLTLNLSFSLQRLHFQCSHPCPSAPSRLLHCHGHFLTSHQQNGSCAPNSTLFPSPLLRLPARKKHIMVCGQQCGTFPRSPQQPPPLVGHVFIITSGLRRGHQG